MCLGKEELRLEMERAKEGKAHSHTHNREDAARIKELHQEIRNEDLQMVGHSHAA